MSETITFRRVAPEEADLLLQVAESTFRAGFEHLNEPAHFEAYMKEAFSIEQTQRELATEGSEFYFAVLSNQVVGYIKLNHGAAQTDLQTEPGMELQRIYVVPDMQGRKIGQQLLDESIKIGRDRDFPYLWLGVWEKNDGAIRFYRRHGFVQFGNHTFMMGDDPQTDFLMKLPLRK